MATLNFPSNPTIGDIYEFEPYRYTWDGEKWKTIGIGYNPAAKLSPTVRSSLKRLASEAGYNLVDGSCEDGATLANTGDVVWHQLSGAYYIPNSYPQNVLPGFNPVGNVNWTAVTSISLKSLIESGDWLGFAKYLNESDNSVAISFLSKLSGRTYDVEEFGALGNGNDDSAAFQLAWNHLKAIGGGTLTGQKKQYSFYLDISGVNPQITFNFQGCTLNPVVGQTHIIYSNNTTYAQTGSNLFIFGGIWSGKYYGSATTGDIDTPIHLVYTSGFDAMFARFAQAKQAAVYGYFAQYCRFFWCIFSSNIATAVATGSYFSGPDGSHRSNEVDFFRCQWFTNKNHCQILGGEKVRFWSPTFQNAITGGTAGLVIGADVGGNGARSCSVNAPYFEFNDSKDVYISTSENTSIRDGQFTSANGSAETPNKTHSIHIVSCYNVLLENNKYITAAAPVVETTHTSARLMVLGDSKAPTLSMTGGDSRYHIVVDGAVNTNFSQTVTDSGVVTPRWNTTLTSGTRGVKWQAVQNGTDVGYIYSNMSSGQMDFNNYFAASSYRFFSNSGLVNFQVTSSSAGPGVDNTVTSGTAALRYSVVYAGTGTINTSDARHKTDVREMTENEIGAAKELADEIGFFQFLVDIERKKGTSEPAREHCGMTVQRVMEIMNKYGLEPFNYGMICYDIWEEQPEITEQNGDGSINYVQQYMPAGDIYSFRENELDKFILAGLNARIKALENK
jgi:hypothetical protein